jgi:hypothetical protein
LRETRKIRDAQNLLAFIFPKIRQNFAVRGIEKLDGAAPKHTEKFAQSDHVPHPMKE